MAFTEAVELIADYSTALLPTHHSLAKEQIEHTI